jgi:hypothetical protein
MKRRSAERTYSCNGLGVEDLLHERYAVRSGLAAPRAGAGEYIVVFERERDCLLLDQGGVRETEILQGAEDERGNDMGKLCERCSLFNNHFVPSFRSRPVTVKILVHVMQLSDAASRVLSSPALFANVL